MKEKADCDALFKMVMPMARSLVDRFGQFYPFAMTMDRQGVIAGLSASPPNDTPSTEEVWNGLRSSLRDLAVSGQLRAAAICVNSRLTMNGATRDAITVFIEHEEGTALEVVVLYEKGEGRVMYDAPMARPSGSRGPEIFAHFVH